MRIFIKDLLRYVKSHLIKKDKRFPKLSLDKILEILTSSYFNKLCEADYSLYFKKIIFLKVLPNSRRVSEFQPFSLSKLNFKYSEKTHNKFVKKNATATYSPIDVNIPEFSENKLICPLNNLRKYLEITDALCQDNKIIRPNQLFINMDGFPITKHQLRAFIRNNIARANPFSLNQGR